MRSSVNRRVNTANIAHAAETITPPAMPRTSKAARPTSDGDDDQGHGRSSRAERNIGDELANPALSSRGQLRPSPESNHACSGCPARARFPRFRPPRPPHPVHLFLRRRPLPTTRAGPDREHGQDPYSRRDHSRGPQRRSGGDRQVPRDGRRLVVADGQIRAAAQVQSGPADLHPRDGRGPFRAGRRRARAARRAAACWMPDAAAGW